MQCSVIAQPFSAFRVLSLEYVCAAIDGLHIRFRVLRSFEFADGSRYLYIGYPPVVQDGPVSAVIPFQKSSPSDLQDFVNDFVCQHGNGNLRTCLSFFQFGFDQFPKDPVARMERGGCPCPIQNITRRWKLHDQWRRRIVLPGNIPRIFCIGRFGAISTLQESPQLYPLP